MNKKTYLAGLFALAAGAALFLQACSGDSLDDNLPGGGDRVPATLVSSPSAVATGVPGAYFISEDRKLFHLRCPCGRCTKSNALPLEAGGGAYVWQLSGQPGKPTLSPSIHWFETNGVTSHWHGWLRDGVFED